MNGGLPIFDQPRADSGPFPENYGPPAKDFSGHARITGPCGDTMEIWLLTNEQGTVADARFTTTGCGSSRSAGSMAARLAVGRTLADARQIEQADILEALGGLPADSEHCALLASTTLKAAVDACVRNVSQ